MDLRIMLSAKANPEVGILYKPIYLTCPKLQYFTDRTE